MVSFSGSCATVLGEALRRDAADVVGNDLERWRMTSGTVAVGGRTLAGWRHPGLT